MKVFPAGKIIGLNIPCWEPINREAVLRPKKAPAFFKRYPSTLKLPLTLRLSSYSYKML